MHKKYFDLAMESFFQKWISYQDCVEDQSTWVFSALKSDMDYLYSVNLRMVNE